MERGEIRMSDERGNDDEISRWLEGSEAECCRRKTRLASFLSGS